LHQGFSANCLELPGHGPQTWDLPSATSLRDYAGLARRAAAELGRPILVGAGMGGWLALKVLEQADLPALLLAPIPGTGLPLPALARLLLSHPAMAAALVRGDRRARQLPSSMPVQPWPLVKEPLRVCAELALGLVRARPRPGRAHRLVVAAGRDYLLPLASLRRLADRLRARLIVLPDHSHDLLALDSGGRVAQVMCDFLAELKEY
jgi:alpha-beta hydrolase superfamily lysophospholipase